MNDKEKLIKELQEIVWKDKAGKDDKFLEDCPEWCGLLADFILEDRKRIALTTVSVAWHKKEVERICKPFQDVLEHGGNLTKACKYSLKLAGLGGNDGN